MLNYIKSPLVALIILGGALAASAAPLQTVQNDKGTFIREQSGAWHKYHRGREVAAPPAVWQAPIDQAKGSMD
jgi:hypothetical protein